MPGARSGQIGGRRTRFARPGVQAARLSLFNLPGLPAMASGAADRDAGSLGTVSPVARRPLIPVPALELSAPPVR